MVSTVVTKLNIGELKQLRNIIQELNPQRWRLIPLEPIGRAAINIPDAVLTSEDIECLVEFVIECRTQEVDNPNITQTELGCGQWYGKELEGLIRPYIWHCIAGINTLGIHYDGSIAACNNINPFFLEGNIRNDNIKDVWEKRYERFRKYDWKKNGECLDCPDWDLCHGGDMHRRRPDGTMIGSCFFRWLINKKNEGR